MKKAAILYLSTKKTQVLDTFSFIFENKNLKKKPYVYLPFYRNDIINSEITLYLQNKIVYVRFPSTSWYDCIENRMQTFIYRGACELVPGWLIGDLLPFSLTFKWRYVFWE